MKKQFCFPKHFMIMLFSILLSKTINAQVSWLANGNPAGGATGINATNNFLGTNGNFAINIKTNNIPRMLINNLGTGSAAGRIAMGNNLTTGFIPRSRLHLHHDDVSNISLRFSNSSTDDNPGDGFEVGYHAISATTNRQYAELNNRENTAMLKINLFVIINCYNLQYQIPAK